MMATETETVERWVVDVVDDRDIEKGWSGYVKRFTFAGEEAAQLAWVCAARAEQAGFKATTGRVQDLKFKEATGDPGGSREAHT